MRETPKDLLERGMSFAIGAAYTTAEGVRAFVDEMVKKGELSRGDARKLASNMVERGKQMRNEMNEAIAHAVAEYLNKAGLATQEEINKLSERVARLERARAKT